MEIMNKNDKEFYYGIDGIFERFPELIPAVGENYGCEDSVHKKLLLVAESNYFPQCAEAISDFMDSEKWYKTASTERLIPSEELKHVVSNWKCSYNGFYRAVSVANELLGLHYGKSDKLLQDHVAFYNYFLRPAGSTRIINPDKLDYQFSGTAMMGVINKLKPDLLLFLSSKAHAAFLDYLTINSSDIALPIIEHVVHPSSMWWWKRGGCYGYAKMKSILQQYWIVK